MERREFLKGSAAAVVGDLALGTPPLTAATDPNTKLGGTQSGKLIQLPAATLDVSDALTKINVTVTIRAFLISPAELTQHEFETVLGYNPSFHKGPDLPVESVTWWEAIRYCNLLSLSEALEPCYNLEDGSCDLQKNGYRLPTDSEWTHAAGSLLAADPAKILANLGSPDTTNLDRLVDELHTAATKPVRSYAPNEHGLYDMLGNVWEWCSDYFNPVQTPQASYYSAGPMRGLGRVIRGGSFVSTTSHWSRGYRSSIEPEYRSRFTGLRICRTAQPKTVLAPVHKNPKWFESYNIRPPGYESSLGDLSSLTSGVNTVREWENRRDAIRAKWLKLLGSIEVEPPPPTTKTVETVRDQNYTAKLMYLQVEPDWWEKILVMIPVEAITCPRPVVIVPFYDVDTPAARNLSGRKFLGAGVDSYAYAAVQKGYIAVAIRWFGESYGEWYTEAVANLKLRHPHSTGLGKWVWDAHRLLDYLYTLPEIDRERISIIGHSLGGKMSLYAAAFDDRITTVVSNELGIGLAFSNYEDYWYFGDFIRNLDKNTDQHELLGLIAPRPFLLIGGDTFDTAKSWHYINAARQVYNIYNKSLDIGYFNHHSGHMPTPEAAWRAMEWLAHFLGTPV